MPQNTIGTMQTNKQTTTEKNMYCLHVEINGKIKLQTLFNSSISDSSNTFKQQVLIKSPLITIILLETNYSGCAICL